MTRYIRYKSGERRNDRRVSLPISIDIMGQTYDVTRWSLSGLEFPVNGNNPSEDIDFSANFVLGEERLPVRGRVARCDAKTNVVALSIKSLASQTFDRLNSYMMRPSMFAAATATG